MSLQESGEMYLETLLVLSNQRDSVRAIHLAETMGVSKAAVSRAITKLKEDGMILIRENGTLGFTEEGQIIAEKIYDRHVKLADLFVLLGVDEPTAAADACKIEHVISDQTFQALLSCGQMLTVDGNQLKMKVADQ